MNNRAYNTLAAWANFGAFMHTAMYTPTKPDSTGYFTWRANRKRKYSRKRKMMIQEETMSEKPIEYYLAYPEYAKYELTTEVIHKDIHILVKEKSTGVIVDRYRVDNKSLLNIPF